MVMCTHTLTIYKHPVKAKYHSFSRNMAEIKRVNAGEKFTHSTVGDISKFTGKQFIKDSVNATSCEVSISTMKPGEAVPFFHSHKQNEEIYIVISGSGDFQVDDNAFPISSGSVIRVAPNCSRSMRCTSTEPMLYICIQAAEHSLKQCGFDDAAIVEQKTMW